MVVVTGSVIIGLATIGGAWLGRRDGARREVYFGAAAGALLVIAGVHILPDAWSAASRGGISVWIVPAVAGASFWLAGLAVRQGCACRLDQQTAGGAGTAAALSLHRLLEGVALALGGSVAVAIALFLHAFAEGLAAGTLLSSVRRRRAALWLAAMCVSPVAGAAAATAGVYPAWTQPVLLAMVAGVLGQAAKVSFGAAFAEAWSSQLNPELAARGQAPSPSVDSVGTGLAATGSRQLRVAELVLSAPSAATVVAALVTTLAVHGVG